ncbi:hypothetical protein EYF80_014907 [Liparis tanakae]|uniref:Uncharacterized protein n=1 Tax=Liparis tanakae TaxID=230148 RepID=A0A4Z2IA22_9TELE|nr:hypothetical protein EYF80_014907 [Liparis tanakae]
MAPTPQTLTQHPEKPTQQADNQQLPHLLQALLSCRQQAAMSKLLEELLGIHRDATDGLERGSPGNSALDAAGISEHKIQVLGNSGGAPDAVGGFGNSGTWISDEILAGDAGVFWVLDNGSGKTVLLLRASGSRSAFWLGSGSTGRRSSGIKLRRAFLGLAAAASSSYSVVVSADGRYKM